MKIQNLCGKGEILNIFHRVEIFSETEGKSETGEKCIIASEGWTPMILAPCIREGESVRACVYIGPMCLLSLTPLIRTWHRKGRCSLAIADLILYRTSCGDRLVSLT